MAVADRTSGTAGGTRCSHGDRARRRLGGGVVGDRRIANHDLGSGLSEHREALLADAGHAGELAADGDVAVARREREARPGCVDRRRPGLCSCPGGLVDGGELGAGGRAGNPGTDEVAAGDGPAVVAEVAADVQDSRREADPGDVAVEALDVVELRRSRCSRTWPTRRCRCRRRTASSRPVRTGAAGTAGTSAGRSCARPTGATLRWWIDRADTEVGRVGVARAPLLGG